MLTMLLVVVALLILFILYYCSRTSNHDYWIKIGVPSASGQNWLFGNYKGILLGQRHFAYMLQDIYKQYPDAPFVGFIKFSEPALLVRDPDVIKTIVATDFDSFEENEYKLNPKDDFLFGYNPFFLYGQQWKMSRAHASPHVTAAKLKMYYPTFTKICKNMTDYIQSKIGNQGYVELETKQLSGMLTTDIVANAVLGIHNDTFKDPNSPFQQVTNEVFSSGTVDLIKTLLFIIFPVLGTYMGNRISPKRNDEVMLSLTKKVMKERAQSGEVRNDIFQAMINYRENDTLGVFTDEYIASHCYGFVVDGYETSSNAICFTLFELAWHTNIQDRLRDEIMDLVMETNDDFTVEHIDKLKYLHMVVSESLRMHPPIYLLSKSCSSDYTLYNNINDMPLHIKKGTPVTIAIHAIHMDEKYYPAPDKFDPERFTDDAIASRHKFTYLPFSEGPRKCIGQRYGLLQVKLAVLYIIKHFKISASTKSKYPAKFDPDHDLSRPLNGAWVKFELLNK